MAIGAILITTGCGTASRAVCGGITVAQRMIASLQKSGVTMIVVVTGPEDKKTGKEAGTVRRVFCSEPYTGAGAAVCAVRAQLPV